MQPGAEPEARLQSGGDGSQARLGAGLGLHDLDVGVSDVDTVELADGSRYRVEEMTGRVTR